MDPFAKSMSSLHNGAVSQDEGRDDAHLVAHQRTCRTSRVLASLSEAARSTGFPAGIVKLRWHEQLQQKISDLSVQVASQMDITSYDFGRFEVPPRESS